MEFFRNPWRDSAADSALGMEGRQRWANARRIWPPEATQRTPQQEQPMPLFSWLLERMTVPRQLRRATARRPAPRFRPHLEALEDRTVLSTFYAATASDLIGD